MNFAFYRLQTCMYISLFHDTDDWNIKKSLGSCRCNVPDSDQKGSVGPLPLPCRPRTPGRPRTEPRTVTAAVLRAPGVGLSRRGPSGHWPTCRRHLRSPRRRSPAQLTRTPVRPLAPVSEPARLSSVRLSSIRLSSVRLSSVRLSSVRLSSVRLSSVRLSSVRLPGFSRPLSVYLSAVSSVSACPSC